MNKAIKYLKDGLLLKQQSLKRYKLNLSFWKNFTGEKDINKIKYRIRKIQKEIKDFEKVLKRKKK